MSPGVFPKRSLPTGVSSNGKQQTAYIVLREAFSGDMMPDDKIERARERGSLETILAAAAIAALANLWAVILLGGYEARLFGLPLGARTVGWPLVILVAALAARWALRVKRGGLRDQLAGLVPLGPFAALLGLVFFFTTVQSAARPAGTAAYVVGAALGVIAFLLAWMTYGREYSKGARAVVFVIYLAGSGGLAGALGQVELWKAPQSRADALQVSGEGAEAQKVYAPSPTSTVTSVQGEKSGLLAGGGSGVSVEKFAVGTDWRNAAAVSPEGFLSAKVSFAANARLDFSVAVRGEMPSGTAAVTVVIAGEQHKLWETQTAKLSTSAWGDVSLPLGVTGDAEIVFEVNGPKAQGAVLFANPRIAGEAAMKTNVILLVEDTLRADRLGVGGYQRPTSPQIDALCRRAVVFDECLAQAPWTIPSMGTIFTSLYPTAHGMVSAEKGLSPSLETAAEAFQRGGFFTGAIQTNPNLTPEAGVAQGFDEYLLLPMRKPTAEDRSVYERAGTANALVVSWLARHADAPFFLYVHYMDTHMPYVPPPAFDRFGPDPSSKYDGSLAYFSNELGRLFAVLAAKGVLDNTVVVLTSDHGEQFWEHGAARHGNCLHAEEMHVPLIAWTPGRKGALRVPERVGTIDIAPTLLDVAGAPALASAQGVSLGPALEGQGAHALPQFGELLAYKPVGEFHVSLTRDNWRFIIANPTNDWMIRYELYDLGADKGEYVNVASRNQALVVAMKGEVDAYLARQKDQHARLVPQEFVFPLSQERMRMLRAIGYLNPGADTGTAK